ncbi:hypothetical protein SESBI_35369 [Sesbania bispinosa]|nr:hypothetical protein SESBI_35369 [Sesbania bispinosa]
MEEIIVSLFGTRLWAPKLHLLLVPTWNLLLGGPVGDSNHGPPTTEIPTQVTQPIETEGTPKSTVEIEDNSQQNFLHGEWLNVTRKKRNKNGNKPPLNHASQPGNWEFHNKFRSLVKEVELVQITTCEAAEHQESASGGENIPNGSTHNVAKFWARKKRPRMSPPQVDIHTLLDNASKSNPKQIYSVVPVNQGLNSLIKLKHVSGCMYEWLEDDSGPTAQDSSNNETPCSSTMEMAIAQEDANGDSYGDGENQEGIE